MDLLEKEWFIEAPWGRICIVAWGNCLNPPVLVVHGQGDSLASFRPLLRLLPANFYYVGMELPGHGKSDPYPRGLPVNVMDLVYCIEIARRHFRWEKFIYLAHSLASTLGRFYNLAYPGRIVAAIELDPIAPTLTFGRPPTETFADWYDCFYGKFYQKYYQLNLPKETRPKITWEQAIEKVQKNRRELTTEHARATIERWSQPAGNGLIRFTLDPRWNYFSRPPFSIDGLKALFTTITTPTVSVIAEGSIKRGLYANTSFMLENYGNYRVTIIPGHHDVHVANPERVAPFVTRFLLYGIRGLDAKSKL